MCYFRGAIGACFSLLFIHIFYTCFYVQAETDPESAGREEEGEETRDEGEGEDEASSDTSELVSSPETSARGPGISVIIILHAAIGTLSYFACNSSSPWTLFYTFSHF